MPKLIICRGLPASGKTTRARAWVAEDPTSRARVNRDDLRRMLHDGVFMGQDTERRVAAARDAAIVALLEQGCDVISDDTNLPQKVARGLAQLASSRSIGTEIWDLTDVPLEECLRRDVLREHGVGADVIAGMHGRYLGGAKYPLPLPYPEARPAIEPYVPDDTLPTAWLVDLDGTLALMDGRSPYDWHRVGEDAVNEPVLEIVDALSHPVRPHIVIVSGRDAVCRPETEAWLDEHEIPYDALFMRPEGDTRKDAVVKLELFRTQIAPRYHVRGVLDDRDQVVEMWRSLGLMCAQVAPGAF